MFRTKLIGHKLWGIMSTRSKNNCYIRKILLLYFLFFCSYAYADVINTPVHGDFTANPGTNYQLESTVTGNFIFNSGTSSLNIDSSGTISGSLLINGGTISVVVDAGARIGTGIIEKAISSPTNLSIFGTVDGGIQLSNQGRKTVTISGVFAEVGLITGDTRSIIGSMNSASIYTISNGAVVNGSIALGNQDDSVTIDNASTGAISGAGGNKVIAISNSALVNGDIDSGNGNDTISINYSTVTGNIRTGTTGNDTLTIIGSLITSSIILGGGSDSLSLQEATSIGGNIVATNSLTMESTFGSTIQGNINITNALILTAPSGIRVNGTTTSGGNSIYTVNRSTFIGAVTFNGKTSLTATDSSFASNITVAQAGPIDITFNNTAGADIVTTSNTNTTSISLQNSSSITNIRLGSGLSTINSESSRIYAIIGNNATITATDSTINNINISNRLEATFIRSTLESPLTTQAGTHATTLTTDSTTFLGDISLLGQTTVNMTNTRVQGNLTTGANSDTIIINTSTLLTLNTGTGNDNITLTNTDINSITLAGGTKTLTINSSAFSLLNLGPNQHTITLIGSNFHQIISPTTPQADNILHIGEQNTITGPYLTIGKGTAFLEGSLYVSRDSRVSTGAPVLIQGTTLQIAEGGIITLSAQPYNSTTYLYFNEIINNSRQAVASLHVNTFNGVKTILDLSQVNKYSNNDYIVHINGVLGNGKPLDRIEGVIIATPAIIPKTEYPYTLLNGNLYSLEESPLTPNSYDLVYQGVSPTNYGYAAAHNALRSFNTNIWHNILSHFQEEANMFRDRNGRPRNAGSIVNAISIWARGGYGMSSIKPSFDTPELNETSITVLAGLDFANIAIGQDSSLLFQFFTGLGDLKSRFKKIPIDSISLSAHHTAITAGGSLGVQKLTHQGRGKLYAIATVWYSIINNDLSSNLFPEANTWTNHSLSFSASLGYSIYLQRVLITPQIDLGYFHTFKKTYVTPDMNIVNFSEDQRMVGRASLLLGYAFPIGFTPYLRGGIELPLFRGKSHGDVLIDSSSIPYSYDTSTFTTDISLGMAYRGGVKHFSVTLSTEATLLLGAKKGIEVFAQLGFQF